MALVLGNNSNNNYIDHGDISAMNGATALSLAFWLWGGAATIPGNIAKHTTVLLNMGGTREYLLKEFGVWTLISDIWTVPIDTWAHFAVVYDGSADASSRMTVYMNAVSLPLTGLNTTRPQGSDPDNTAPTALTIIGGTSLEIGNSNVSGVTGHLRLWAAVLTQAEVAQEMHRYWAVRQADALLDAPYDDALYARDYSAAANHGTWVPALGQPDQRQGPPVPYGGKVLVTG